MFIAIAGLLLVPLCIRYLTSWHMGRLRTRALQCEQDLRAIRKQYAEVREQLIDVRRVVRQCEARGSHIQTDIFNAQERLRELRSDAPDRRIAA
ncbi:MAG: hypothetical protein VX733_14690 [Candidatus Latescibacterota bacterium]|nr:hypothetical protein [Candidatus Latescibacterota bacterium]